MIIWGGQTTRYPGHVYDLATDSWSVLPTTTIEPKPRYSSQFSITGHDAVWTGSEMIVWGGYQRGIGSNSARPGWRYAFR